MRIRDYGPADADAVIAIVRELQVHEAQYFDRMRPARDIGPWYVERVLDDCARQSGHLVVAERDGAVVGYASLLVMSAEDERDEVPYTYGLVGDLAVLRANRGQGIGQALIADCERRARAAGLRWLRLGVLAGNTGARRFYARSGFDELLLTLEKPLS